MTMPLVWKRFSIMVTHCRVESARKAARLAEDAIMRGDAMGVLYGLPISVKDLISVAGCPWEFGSRTMAGNVATFDAPSVERVRAQGAIIIGKTTTSEFGCKAVGDSPATGLTRNPWNLSKTPGGSSAGAAASVAAGVTSLALGTDGGGSLRIPAALTGLVGFIQAQILDLLADLQGRLGTALLFISHDWGVIQHLADRVLVFQEGRIVDQGSVADVFGSGGATGPGWRAVA